MDRSYQVTLTSQMFIVKELMRRLFLVYGVLFAIAETWLWHGKHLIVYGAAYFACFLIVEAIPSALFHLQYHRRDRGKVLCLDSAGRTMTVDQNGSSDTFKLSDLVKSGLILDPFLYRGRKRGQASWGIYHYGRLHTNDGKIYIITCLLVNDLRKFFGDLGVEVTKVKRVYPIVRSK